MTLAGKIDLGQFATVEAESFPPGSRRRGRPPRLSADTVVRAAVTLLNSGPAESFTMTGVAQAVGTTTMALYRYFPSREALLEAVSDHVFGQFQVTPPRPGERWQDTLFGWQCALKTHFQRYPALTKLMAWNGRISGAWMRVLMPVVEALHAAGFRGHQLAYASKWFLTDTAGLLTIELADLLLSDGASRPHNTLNISDSLEQLTEAQKRLILDMSTYSRNLDNHQILEFAFRHLIAGMEVLLATGAPEEGNRI